MSVTIFFSFSATKMCKGASSLRQHCRGPRRIGFPKGGCSNRSRTEHIRTGGMVALRTQRKTGNFSIKVEVATARRNIIIQLNILL